MANGRRPHRGGSGPTAKVVSTRRDQALASVRTATELGVEAAGCAGVDLLAYRATDAGPLDLVRAARAATTGRLVVAGSITTADQIQALASAGADAFTIGSAAFDGSLRPHAGTLRSQLAPVVGL
ncbi:hypothetical protein P1P68_02115 [Streptomyces scabiei]|uniref:hypothetical protein n=1 Tax=Streptomyces scabiei TaxID=1930 RepID=UPI00298F6D1C|nr:hypothetical protein [Streptomyces scabiei]MDW8803630.1 hypothetical protein [Streptomyces scabiei]